MSSPARTPAAGLPHPAWPVRPVSPPVSAEHRPARPVAPPASPVPEVPVPEVPVVVTAQEQELDPRTIARASLAAGRNRSLWWTLGGIAACVVVAFVTDAVIASVVLGVLLLAYAVVRAVGPEPGPAAVTVRTKPLDVAVLAGCGIALVVLAAVLPAP